MRDNDAPSGPWNWAFEAEIYRIWLSGHTKCDVEWVPVLRVIVSCLSKISNKKTKQRSDHLWPAPGRRAQSKWVQTRGQELLLKLTISQHSKTKTMQNMEQLKHGFNQIGGKTEIRTLCWSSTRPDGCLNFVLNLKIVGPELRLGDKSWRDKRII